MRSGTRYRGGNQSHRMRSPRLPRFRSSQIRRSSTVRSSLPRIQSRKSAVLDTPRFRAFASNRFRSFSANRTLKAFICITCALRIKLVKRLPLVYYGTFDLSRGGLPKSLASNMSVFGPSERSIRVSDMWCHDFSFQEFRIVFGASIQPGELMRATPKNDAVSSLVFQSTFGACP